MDNRPIGVYDSGLGGLTAVRELDALLPNEKIIYFGDTSRVPYGNRSRETLMKYIGQDVAFLLHKNVKLILAACGTASSVAGDLSGSLPVKYINVLSPTAVAAAKATKNKKIGIIGTAVTIASGSYRRELTAIDPTLQLFEAACPLFVPLVENGFIAPDNAITRLTVEHYLLPLKAQGIDTLILGCTHYPIISENIAAVMGPEVRLINAGKESARACADYLRQNALCGESARVQENEYYVSDRPEGFAQLARIFLGKDIVQKVERIDINGYETAIS